MAKATWQSPDQVPGVHSPSSKVHFPSPLVTVQITDLIHAETHEPRFCSGQLFLLTLREGN